MRCIHSTRLLSFTQSNCWKSKQYVYWILNLIGSEFWTPSAFCCFFFFVFFFVIKQQVLPWCWWKGMSKKYLDLYYISVLVFFNFRSCFIILFSAPSTCISTALSQTLCLNFLKPFIALHFQTFPVILCYIYFLLLNTLWTIFTLFLINTYYSLLVVSFCLNTFRLFSMFFSLTVSALFWQTFCSIVSTLSLLSFISIDSTTFYMSFTWQFLRPFHSPSLQ